MNITSVSIAEPRGDRLSNVHVGGPAEAQGDHVLALDGSLTPSGGPDVAAVDFKLGGEALWHVPVRARTGEGQESGFLFFARLSALRLPHAFELELECVWEDGLREPIATVTGTRAPLRSPFRAEIQPLLLTTLARTGATVLTRLLAVHPSLVAYRPFEFEPRVAGYWVEVLKTLSEPASYIRQLVPPRPGPEWFLPVQPAMLRFADEPDLAAWFGGEAIEELAVASQSRIDAVYSRLAAREQRNGARYFIEKYRPGDVQALVHELYPEAREIVLVRDLRDVLCSMLAFSAKRGRKRLGLEHTGSEREFVEVLRQRADRLLMAWRERNEHAHLVRYEDLIESPAATVEELLAHLGLDAPPRTVEAMVANLSVETGVEERHRTARSAAASVGRWRDDLPPELRDAASKAFAPFLESFGYE